MPPRRRTPAPIPIDVEAIRRKLADGKIVRVGISRSAHFPDGGTGRVRQVGNPEVDGEEFIQVELSLNGTRDILPFTPADLTPATRGKPPVEPAVAQPTARARPIRPPVSQPSAPSAAQHKEEPVPPVDRPAPATARPDSTPGPSNPSPERPPASEKGAVASRSRSPRAPRRSPPVSISIATTDAEPTQWRIEARVGARVVLRHGSVSPARVWELVKQLDEPTLITAVGGILDEQRKAAQARADALATELAKVRAELEALPNSQP